MKGKPNSKNEGTFKRENKRFGTLPKGVLNGDLGKSNNYIKFDTEEEQKILIVEEKSKGNKLAKKNKKELTTEKNNKEIKVTSNKEKNKIKNKDTVKSDLLLQEITALGGTKDDYSFLEEVETEEEEINGEESEEDEKLKAQLSKFIKGLGITKIRLEEEDEDEDKEKEVVDEKLKGELESVWEDIKEGEDDIEVDGGQKENDERIPDSIKNKKDDENFDAPTSLLVDSTAERAFSNSAIKVNPMLGKSIKKSILEGQPNWYEHKLEELEEGEGFSSEYSKNLYQLAQDLAQQENEVSTSNQLSQNDQKFMKDILSSGTLSDKVSALTLQIQEDPLHRVQELDKMFQMMKRNNRRESLLCLNAFKDLCLSNLLPDRKLKYFEDQPLSSSKLTQKHLILWWFEDYLKKAYFEFLVLAENRSHDPLLYSKQSMLNHFYGLLKGKPEQESNLLTLIVNKLGDKENKISSNASHLLLKVLEEHPLMKSIVASEVEKILFRPNITLRAQYYAIITLNQFVLERGDKELANYLMEIYFTLFKKIMVNKDNEIQKKDKKVKKVRKRDLKKGNKKQNSVSIDPTSSTHDAEKLSLIAAILTGVNRAFPYSEIEKDTLKQHVSTLFYISRAFNFNAAIQSLNLLNQISLQQMEYRDTYYKRLYHTLFDHRLIYSSKQSMYLNLLFKSLKKDTKIERVMSFIKRMCQVSAWHQVPFVNGLLYIIYKLLPQHVIIGSSISQPEDKDVVNNEDENEDQNEKEEKDNDDKSNENENEDEDETQEINKEDSSIQTAINSKMYDGRNDDPLVTKAEYTCLWELGGLKSHFHPTVTYHIQQLLTNQTIDEQPHLHLHTLQHFLDLFAYRNPKKSEPKVTSVMQGNKENYWAKGYKNMNEVINSDQFKDKNEDEVRKDQVFFLKFFKLSKKNQNRKLKNQDLSEDENEDEEGVENFLLENNPDGLNLDEEEDEEVDLGDLDFDDDEDEDEDEDDPQEEEEEEEEEGNEGESEDENENENEELIDTSKALSFDDFMEASLNQDNDESDMEDIEDSEKEESDDNDDESDDDIEFDLNENSDSETESQPVKKRKSNPSTSNKVLALPTKGPNNERNRKSRQKRKKLKELPTFADAESYISE